MYDEMANPPRFGQRALPVSQMTAIYPLCAQLYGFDFEIHSYNSSILVKGDRLRVLFVPMVTGAA